MCYGFSLMASEAKLSNLFRSNNLRCAYLNLVTIHLFRAAAIVLATVVALLADPERGRVLYRGRDVRELDVLSLRREVCLVPQLPALLEGTVAENVAFGARLAGRPTDVGRALDLAGLAPSFADRAADRLSVGEQQRVMLARALALRPAVLLLDEPTSALDADTRDAVEATLLELRERLALSYVLVTHDLGQAERLSDSVLRLEGGRAVEALAT